MGWVQILEGGIFDEAAVKRGIEVIGRNARTQTKLIEDILDYARITSGKLNLEIKQIDLIKLVEIAVDGIKPLADAKQIELQTVLDSNALVSGDSYRLQQVLGNLLQNAVKFTPENGKVQITVKKNVSDIEISISDTGKGISTDFLPYVFERFQQAEQSKSGRNTGLGLGLAIVKNLAEALGGRVTVESQVGKGSTFRVFLPTQAVEPVTPSAVFDGWRTD
ncbi:MAG: HAMP domain-containing histidine kinase [Blastocatellia bacterium]|nr:HAMP domain-containing histidine kinase [Blastocatellia bacterium]